MTPTAAPIRPVAPTRNSVTGSAAQLTSTGNNHGLILKAICPGQTIYIGTTIAVTTATGYPMADGETLTLEIQNANQLFAISSSGTQSLAVLPYSRY